MAVESCSEGKSAPNVRRTSRSPSQPTTTAIAMPATNTLATRAIFDNALRVVSVRSVVCSESCMRGEGMASREEAIWLLLPGFSMPA